MTPKVTLLSHTPQPEKLVAAAARMCYSAASADTMVNILFVGVFISRLV